MRESKKRTSENTVRIPYMIEKKLFDRMTTMAEKHLPQPTKAVYFEFILGLGMDAYEEKQMLANVYDYKKRTPYRLIHRIKREVFERLVALVEAHEPPTSRRAFMEYILHLGMERYYKEYTIYGFKKD